LTLIVGFTGAVMRIAYTSFDCYQSVALVKVELAHRGSIGGIVAVFLSYRFVCSISSMDRGARYGLFLNPSVVGYQPSRYGRKHLARQRGTRRGATSCLGSRAELVVSDFIAAIPSALKYLRPTTTLRRDANRQSHRGDDRCVTVLRDPRSCFAVVAGELQDVSRLGFVR
jgi:hypothetical protein